MSQQSPSAADDHLLWNLHLSAFAVPALTAADELGVFDDLAVAPASCRELAARLGLNRRAVRALLPLLASEGLLVQHLGRYHLTHLARDYLVRSSSLYWGPVLTMLREFPMSHRNVMQAMQVPDTAAAS